MTWHKLPFANQNQIKPLAYMATTILLESQKLAIFGGLTQFEPTGEFKVVNEILFFDLQSGKWQKPSRVYVERMNDMPSPRMGASMVNYGEKLYIYAGADPYISGNVYSDFFSFNIKSGLWHEEQNFSGLESGDGALLGQALRMYNSDAVIFSGGCNTLTKKCSFGATRSILFEQPQANLKNSFVDVDELEF